MKRHKILIFLMTYFLITSSSQAIYLSSFIYEMSSDEEFFAKSVKNDTQTTNMYQISALKIDKPGKKGENIIYEKNRELIFTPLKLQVEPNGNNFFKIIYIGPKDDKERYYRVNFIETPLTSISLSDNKSNLTSYFPSISLSTILVVRPRHQILKYEIDENIGVLKNIGNTFFRVIIQQGCDSRDEDAQQFYMLPEESYQNESLKKMNKKFIVANKRYYLLGKLCNKEDS